MDGGFEDGVTDRYQAPTRAPGWLNRRSRELPLLERDPDRATTDASRAHEHRQWTPLARGLVAAGDQWTLLIVLALAGAPLRLSVLRQRLPGISSGVLSRHLQQMLELDLISRQRFREMSPRVEYRLSDRGAELLPIAGHLARWGMRHMWADPLMREQIDIGVLLGMLPTLVEDTPLPNGVVELTVERHDGVEQYLFDLSQGRLIPIELGVTVPWTRVAGRPQAWIDALGPGRRYESLQITGSRQLAVCLLEALPR
jgi:DNA-binding HxlR family transcriptional regulator